MNFYRDLDRYLASYEQAELLADEEERMMSGESDFHVNGEDATEIPEYLVNGEADDNSAADVAEAIRAENEAHLDAIEAHYGIEPRGWEDSY